MRPGGGVIIKDKEEEQEISRGEARELRLKTWLLHKSNEERASRRGNDEPHQKLLRECERS